VGEEIKSKNSKVKSKITISLYKKNTGGLQQYNLIIKSSYAHFYRVSAYISIMMNGTSPCHA
jgi:hypothetical protein